MAEHSAVNRVVVGSSPTWGAKASSFRSLFVLLFHIYIQMQKLASVKIFFYEDGPFDFEHAFEFEFASDYVRQDIMNTD